MGIRGRSSATPAALCAVALVAAACTPERTVGVRFRSEAIRRSVTDVGVFLFRGPGGAGAEGTTCADLEPQGLPYGDAEARTGRTAEARAMGPLRDTLAELPEIAAGPYALAVEAWGPPCAEVEQGRDDEPVCARPGEGRPILRGYQCEDLDLGGSTRASFDLDLRTFAEIGSTMRVPTNFPVNAILYDEREPLPVVDGLIGRDRFIVQLLNANSEPDDEVLVRWSVTSGAGSIEGREVVPTALDESLQDRGLSSAFLRAGITASSVDGGRLIVSAYAPGYEQSPIELSARALRGVELDVTEIPLPRERIDLAGQEAEFRPVLADDLDGDGRADLVLVGGRPGRCSGEESSHALAVLYGREGGTFQPAYSGPVPKLARALSSARIDGSGQRVLLVATSSFCGDYQGTTFGSAYVVQQPGIEVWSGLGDVPEPGDDTLRGQRTELTRAFRCMGSRSRCEATAAPLTRGAIAIAANDVDGDGVDELAISGCSYIINGSSGVECHGQFGWRSDAEVALFSAEIGDGTITNLYHLAAIAEQGNDGGYREVQLADISGDGSLDLVASTDTEVTVVCGRRNMPDTGFGFASNPQRFDAQITFAESFSVGVGRFNSDDKMDALVGGGHRSTSPISGVKLNPGTDCGFGMGAAPVTTGPTTRARLLIVRVADLNDDDLDDALVLHRETRTLHSFFGSGTNLLARGPVLALPSGVNGELGLFVESPGDGQTAVAVTTGPEENTVIVARLRPARR